jgi:hypothetical protein
MTNNQVINQKLSNAQFCVAVLESKGADITSINITDTKPVITVLYPLKELQTVVKKRFLDKGRNWETHAIEMERCQVEWTVPAARNQPTEQTA